MATLKRIAFEVRSGLKSQSLHLKCVHLDYCVISQESLFEHQIFMMVKRYIEVSSRLKALFKLCQFPSRE